MNGSANFARLLWRSLAALLVCTILVVLCYLFVDRHFAYFVHDHKLSDYEFLKWLTYPPPIVQAWTPVLLAALAIRRAFGPFRRWEVTVLAASVGMVLADQFRETLGFVFGRYWPETWIRNNLSLIRDGAYGFHPFQGDDTSNSFPSGHTARTFAVAAVLWIAYPRWRWLYILAAAGVPVGLLGMNYHFVGDVIAGGFVGAIVGAYTAQFCGLGMAAAPSRSN